MNAQKSKSKLVGYFVPVPKLIKEFISDTPDFNEYVSDQKTQSSVERQLYIIGEAVNKYRQIKSDHNLANANDIVGFRNRLIHDYDGIDETIVWAVIINHLPILKKEIGQILNN